MNRPVIILFFILSSLSAFCHPGEDCNRMPPPCGCEGGRGFMNFRGMRKPVEEGDFYISEIQLSSAKDGIISVNLFFTRPLDPRSLRPESIRVNEEPCAFPRKISFNKEGNQMRILIKENKNSDSVSIKLEGIQSFEGSSLPPSEIQGLTAGSTYIFNRETKEWKKF